MPVEWKEYITSDPEILHGKPRLKGTRIPASLILGYLAAGKTAEEITAGGAYIAFYVCAPRTGNISVTTSYPWPVLAS